MHSGHFPPPSSPASIPTFTASPIRLASTVSMPDFIAAVASAQAREQERAYCRAQRTRVLRALVCTLAVTVGGLGWALLTQGIPQW